MTICIINGPNLNLLGKRETNVYGSLSFEEFLDELKAEIPDLNKRVEMWNVLRKEDALKQAVKQIRARQIL